MSVRNILILFSVVALLVACTTEEQGKHLFILSGQSNMARLNPEETFTPAVKERFGENQVIVIKDAQGGQPIRRWFRGWNDLGAQAELSQADLYEALIIKVNQAIKGKDISSVTIVWMQGERDAKEGLGEVYEKSLLGLYEQLCSDLDRNDVSFVIGRLSDFDMQNESYQHWTMIRDIQVAVAESAPNFEWVDTDDLNDGLNRKGESITNDLHMSAEGYKILGTRFAETSIELIERANCNCPY